MAHNINFNERTGRYSFFSVQQKAWHGLGQIVEQYPTSEEAIQHAGLDHTPHISAFKQILFVFISKLVSKKFKI
ncbi:hypothetical protein EV142_101176 [Flavobacterium circumlabens]|uniref:Uncharacterized protein n=1 Tax=Flavobacterium circumlabens TaxID=2133765 RepID=A0ABY2B3Z0_9FLAO|nr:hypothetical protein EV142_101176 [Flavobacterium circumlabens]